MSNSERQQFSSPDWSMEVAADAGLNGSGSYHADVFRLGTFVCRIALARQFADLHSLHGLEIMKEIDETPDFLR